jgi:hypothetical protein
LIVSHSQLAPWRKLMPIDLSALARVGELIEPISGKQHSESGVTGE